MKISIYYLFIFIHINILWYTSTYSLRSSDNNADNNIPDCINNISLV